MITKRIVLAMIAGATLAACAPKPAPVSRVEQNPALRILDDRGDRDLSRILRALDDIIEADPKPVTRGGALTAREKQLIFENTLIQQAYQRDAKATLKLVRVILPKLK